MLLCGMNTSVAQVSNAGSCRANEAIAELMPKY